MEKDCEKNCRRHRTHVKKYIPELRYAFCAMRPRSLWPQKPLIKYLNSMGQVPYLIVSTCVQPKDIEKMSPAAFRLVKTLLSDYDVLFSESSGHTKFERDVALRSKAMGKVNLKIQNTISVFNHFANDNYKPNKTDGIIDGICMREQRGIKHYKEFTRDIYFLNTGDPEWDQFKTRAFRETVRLTKERYGKFLLLGMGFINGPEETAYCKRFIDVAKSMSIQPILCLHPGRQCPAPKLFCKYIDETTPRWVLFAAADWIIENMCSALTAESLFLRKRVGCTPAIRHYERYGAPHVWIEKYKIWQRQIIEKAGRDLFRAIPRVNSTSQMESFLTSNEMYPKVEEVDRIFGWPKVPCYCSHFFKTVEKKVLYG